MYSTTNSRKGQKIILKIGHPLGYIVTRTYMLCMPYISCDK